MAWAKIQSINLQTGGVTSPNITITSTIPFSSGSVIGVTVAFADPGGPTPLWTVTDNSTGVNTYPQVDNAFTAVANFSFATYYGYVSVGGFLSITAASTGNTRDFISMTVSEFSGASSAPLDVHALQIQDGGVNPIPGTGVDGVTSGSAATTSSGELIYATTVNVADHGSISFGTGFSSAFNDNVYASEYLVQLSAGLIAGTFTAGSSQDQYITGMMTFKPLSGATTVLQVISVPQDDTWSRTIVTAY